MYKTNQPVLFLFLYHQSFFILLTNAQIIIAHAAVHPNIFFSSNTGIIKI